MLSDFHSIVSPARARRASGSQPGAPPASLSKERESQAGLLPCLGVEKTLVDLCFVLAHKGFDSLPLGGVWGFGDPRMNQSQPGEK